MSLLLEGASAPVEETGAALVVGDESATISLPPGLEGATLGETPPRVIPTWRAHPTPPREHIEALAQAVQIPPLLAHLLINRGCSSREAALAFLLPKKHRRLDGPMTMIDMEPGAARILQALTQHESIFISGDYDVDGITSTTIMLRGLQALGAALGSRAVITPYVPDRKAGFGLNALSVGFAKHRGATLIITVDNGTAGDKTRSAVQAARDAGIDVVVTDHHPPDLKGLPNAVAVVNPNRPDCPSRFKQISGAVVAWKVVWGVSLLAGLPRETYSPILESLLDLTALGLIADVMPLEDENRFLATLGLARMGHSPLVGLQLLTRSVLLSAKETEEMADSSPEARARALLTNELKRPVTAFDVGMKIAPRLNAAGRLYLAQTAFETLVEPQVAEAMRRVDELSRMNKERQAACERMREEALALLARDGVPAGGIALALPHWNPGIVGIEANKVGEWCHRPTFLLGEGDVETFKGSGRSLDMVNLEHTLKDPRVAATLVAGGGHEGAAGVTVRRADFPAFAAAFDAVCQEHGYAHRREAELWADAEVTPADCTEAAATFLKRLEPCGKGNPAPLFLLKGVRVTRLDTFNKRSDGTHSWKLTVTAPEDHTPLVLKWWDAADRRVPAVGEVVDILFNKLELNTWGRKKNVEGTVVDLRLIS